MLFQRSDWTLFRSLDTLGQRAGVPRNRLGAIVAKELADNALDAGSEVVRVVVGELTAYSGTWDADSRAKAEATLAAILCDQPEALAYLTRALEEVQL